MAKFGKLFRKRHVNEWDEHYMNYKLLKQKIKEISNCIQQLPSASTEPRVINDINKSGSSLNSLSVLYDQPNGPLLKDFIDLLDREFKRVYVFFVSMEKELYKKINLHLYVKQSYHTFSIKEVHEEVTSLWFTIYLALSLLRFINDNMMAMKSILKKFDKKFNQTFGFISLKYLTDKLANSNSDLDYLLHFKIIDETSAITESLTKTLKSIYKNEQKLSVHHIQFEESIEPSEERLSIPTEDFVLQIKTKFKEIKGYVIRIDECNHFRVQYRELMSYINENDKITKNSPNTLSNDMYNPLLSCTLVNDSIMEKFISWDVNTSIRYHEVSLSRRNKTNVIFCFMHTLLYNMIYSSLIPTVSLYLRDTNHKNQYLCGVIFAMAPLFSMISVPVFQAFFPRKYKLSFAMSYVLLIIGSILYSLNTNQQWYLMLIGRIFIGFGSAPIMPRTYVTAYLSKYYLPKISQIYLIISAFGFFLGPIICLGASSFAFTLNKRIRFNESTNVGWIGSVISLVFLILHVIFFSDPHSSSFSMLNINKDNEDYKLNLTFTNVPFLSQEEKKMLNQIDTKLDQFNENNNFTNINLIPSEIERIVQREQGGLHYFSKNICIVLSLLFISRLLTEGVIVRPLNVFKSSIIDLELMDYYWFVIGIYAARIIPYVFVHQLSYQSRRFRLSLISALATGIGLSAILCIVLSEKVSYCIIAALLSFLACVIEISISSLISLILPPKWTFLKVNSSYLIYFSISLGQVVGPSLLTMISNLEIYLYVILGFTCVVFVSIIILLAIYTDFRVKAIAKILRNQITSKMMME